MHGRGPCTLARPSGADRHAAHHAAARRFTEASSRSWHPQAHDDLMASLQAQYKESEEKNKARRAEAWPDSSHARTHARVHAVHSMPQIQQIGRVSMRRCAGTQGEARTGDQDEARRHPNQEGGAQGRGLRRTPGLKPQAAGGRPDYWGSGDAALPRGLRRRGPLAFGHASSPCAGTTGTCVRAPHVFRGRSRIAVRTALGSAAKLTARIDDAVRLNPHFRGGRCTAEAFREARAVCFGGRAHTSPRRSVRGLYDKLEVVLTDYY